MKLFSTMLAALLLATFAGTATAQGEALFAKTHRGAKESKVASDWYDKLPKYIHSRTVKNDFPKTHLPYEVDKDRLKPMRSGVNKFEIRDANDREFSAFFMAPDGVDGAGMTRYVTTEKNGWIPWRAWPAKYIVETYPVESNTEVADIVALGAWLYTEKENNLANRVLNAAHRMDRGGDLGPLIEAYICEKEKWELPPEGLVEWGAWDIEYQTERVILVTPTAREEMKTAREKEAERAFKDLLAARGDYKGRPPRRRSPTRSLARLDWDFRQFEISYKNTDFLKEGKTQALMQEIKDSITNDIGLLNDNKKQAREMPHKNDTEQREKAEFLEQILQIDPMDIALRADVAAAWYEWADVDAHGNSAARVQGLKNAIPHYEEVLKIYPFSTAFLLRMGQCYQAQEDSKKARGYFEAVIDIAGTKGDAVTAKALIRNMEIKDSTRAKKGR